jgi:transposase
MDNEPVTAKSLSWTYMIQDNTFARVYKDTLSDFPTWVKKENVDDGILIAKNLGPRLGIDESEFGHEVYTILHNKDAHGKKGAIVAIVKGTDPETVAKVLRKMPQKDREAVGLVSMDLSDSMRSIVRMAFPNAMVVRDCFHVMKRGGEGIEELRMKYKREAVKDVNRQKAEFKKHLEQLAKQRKYYRNSRKKQGKKRCKGKRRGRKPMRLNTRFEPKRLSNGETLVEALTRCKKQLGRSYGDWSINQKKRARILFRLFPKLKEAYWLINDLRAIFRTKSNTKATAKKALEGWYKKVTKSTLREIKSVKQSIQHYEDEILNYFINRDTNASAESLNSKMKAFRSCLKGIRAVHQQCHRSKVADEGRQSRWHPPVCTKGSQQVCDGRC